MTAQTPLASTACTIDVLSPGLFTTVQDTPGRLGYWMVGIPPSGAMDDLALRFANRIVANPPDAAGLECTVTGPTVVFDAPTTVALTGANLAATLNGFPIPYWSPLTISPGDRLYIGTCDGPGMRAYLAVRGGIDVPAVLGSRATFDLARMGGHEGRALQAGDRLVIGVEPETGLIPSPVPASAQPTYTNSWHIGVTEGPHAAPEFLTGEGFEQLLATQWVVQQHAARTGVRLEGPAPKWARDDGGEAGLHPSNIHDSGYAFGAVDLTGDTPILLGPDGPSLGGFVTPAIITANERWKLGQLAPGDMVRFVLVDEASTAEIRAANDDVVSRLRRSGQPRLRPTDIRDEGILAQTAGSQDRPAVTYRRAGDEFVLMEYGDMSLDLALRARIHVLDQRLANQSPDAVIDATAGIRSLLVHFDPDLLTGRELVELLQATDEALPPSSELVVDNRVVDLPLSWEDPATLEAIRRYMDVVRDDAPWCPSNLEFIRRINGLDSIDDVHRIVFDASYLVLGLGDVYLGAPVATPLDPRHRLVTTKYNPARTWTPENAVGIGGAYLCVYGMEGPGGYQFVGRTVPVWYLDVPTPGPDPDTPWLLRQFDQLRFHPVEADELMEQRARAREGELEINIEPATFAIAHHQRWLQANATSIDAFKTEQKAAFEAERQRWLASGELSASIRK